MNFFFPQSKKYSTKCYLINCFSGNYYSQILFITIVDCVGVFCICISLKKTSFFFFVCRQNDKRRKRNVYISQNAIHRNKRFYIINCFIAFTYVTYLIATQQQHQHQHQRRQHFRLVVNFETVFFLVRSVCLYFTFLIK